VALRGELFAGPVEVVRSRFAEAAAVGSVTAMLERMGVASCVVEDSEAPMLVKNVLG
jgi:hypothetical protein